MTELWVLVHYTKSHAVFHLKLWETTYILSSRLSLCKQRKCLQGLKIILIYVMFLIKHITIFCCCFFTILHDIFLDLTLPSKNKIGQLACQLFFLFGFFGFYFHFELNFGSFLLWLNFVRLQMYIRSSHADSTDFLAQLPWAIEYTDCISVERLDSSKECPDMTPNNLMVMLQ